MNLFILDTDPVEAAKQNCDRHVCKIIIEAAQMLSMAHRVSDTVDIPGWIYNTRSQRNNHVCKWVRENLSNYRWTVAHAIALGSEYTRRYGKIHACMKVIVWCQLNEPQIPDAPLTPFRQAVAKDCYNDDIVLAYRDYYIRYKSGFAKWKSGPVLEWYVTGLQKHERKIQHEYYDLREVHEDW